MKPLKWLDDWLNAITMYRLLLYGLLVIVAIAITFCFSGVLSLSGTGLLLSTGILLAVCYVTNKILGFIFRAPTNSESSLITALILACILPQATKTSWALYIALAGALAIASKYLLAWRHKHAFNPAAAGALTVGLLSLIYANWWIGNPSMLPFTVIFGLLVVRKIRRFPLVLTFALTALAVSVIVGANHGVALSQNLRNVILSGPLVFFGMIMLTEPSTMPPTRYYQLLYGGLVGVLFASQLHVGTLYASPQTALILGNVFAFAVSFKQKLKLTLKEKNQISPVLYDFVFTPNRPFKFIPGQYMEWTLPHKHMDGRGNRRTFTVASSPTEKEVRLGIKFYDPSSTFKQTLNNLKPGQTINAGMLAGDFTLPPDSHKKLVWVAGGIGITPFRSFAKYLIDTNQHRDVTLFYLISKPDEIAYHDIWEAVKSIGINVIFSTDRLTPEMLAKEVPDFRQRSFYISGPNAMVQSYKDMIKKTGVKRSNITTDYFSGY